MDGSQRCRDDPFVHTKQVAVMSGLSIVAGSPGKYIHWGVIQISVANLAIICVMMSLKS